jgi:hypothetical protein
MITSLKKPIAIKRDGDSYEYMTQGKLEFVSPVFPNPAYTNNTLQPVQFTLLPSGLVCATGTFFIVTAGQLGPVCVIPNGFKPAFKSFFAISKVIGGSLFSPSTILFDLELVSIGPSATEFPVGLYDLGAIQYIPSGG